MSDDPVVLKLSIIVDDSQHGTRVIATSPHGHRYEIDGVKAILYEYAIHGTPTALLDVDLLGMLG